MQVDGGFCPTEEAARAACSQLQNMIAPSKKAQKAAAQPTMRALGAGPVMLSDADPKSLLLQEQSFRHMIQV